jgi:hypothetical protein
MPTSRMRHPDVEGTTEAVNEAQVELLESKGWVVMTGEEIDGADASVKAIEDALIVGHLDELTKDELLTVAAEAGLPAKPRTKKADLIAAIETGPEPDKES